MSLGAKKMELSQDDMVLTWGEYMPCTEHVFYRVDDRGVRHYVLSADKTREIRRINLQRLGAIK